MIVHRSCFLCVWYFDFFLLCHLSLAHKGRHVHGVKEAQGLASSKLSSRGFPGGSEVKASARNAGDLGSIPGSGRSPGEGNGNPLQYSWLENPMDGGAW